MNFIPALSLSLSYAHVRFVKILFENIQKQQNMLTIGLLFIKIYKIQGANNSEFLGLKILTFQGIAFM